MCRKLILSTKHAHEFTKCWFEIRSCDVFARYRITKQRVHSTNNSVMVISMEHSWRKLRDVYFVYGVAEGNGRKAQRMYSKRFPQRRCPHFRIFSATYDRPGNRATLMVIIIIISVLPKGRSFTAISGTKAAILPNGRFSIANSGN